MQDKGLTLIELLIALAVAGLLLGLAAPAFQTMIQNNRASSLSNTWVSALKYTRQEAIHRGESVSVCPAGNTAFSFCGADWEQGWMIFVNPDEDAVFANNTAEPLLRAHEALASNTTFTTTPTTSMITFTSRGFPNSSSSNVTFNLSANGCVGENGRSISISPTGRISVTATICP